MTMTSHQLGECPRVGCDKTITVVIEEVTAHVLHHECKGKPYTTKEKPSHA